jgi:hypothetical protein
LLNQRRAWLPKNPFYREGQMTRSTGDLPPLQSDKLHLKWSHLFI